MKEFFKGILRLLPDMGDFACLSAAALQKVQHFDQCGLQVLGPPALSHQDRRPFQVESANVCKVIKKAHFRLLKTCEIEVIILMPATV